MHHTKVLVNGQCSHPFVIEVLLSSLIALDWTSYSKSSCPFLKSCSFPVKWISHLLCLPADITTDTLVDLSSPRQMIGWQLPVYPSDFIGNPGDLARQVSLTQKQIQMDGIRNDLVDGLRGRCWYYDGTSYYYSRHFPILVPHSSKLTKFACLAMLLLKTESALANSIAEHLVQLICFHSLE